MGYMPCRERTWQGGGRRWRRAGLVGRLRLQRVEARRLSGVRADHGPGRRVGARRDADRAADRRAGAGREGDLAVRPDVVRRRDEGARRGAAEVREPGSAGRPVGRAARPAEPAAGRGRGGARGHRRGAGRRGAAGRGAAPGPARRRVRRLPHGVRPMKRFLSIALGILTAIGGFVDIGDIVANAEAGARFGIALAWVLLVGVVGICVYAEMSGRVTAVSGRAVFDLVRERLGPRVALANLAGSVLVTVLTLGAEIGGVGLALQLATSVDYLLWVPVVAVVLWVALWRAKFSMLENVFGLTGLVLIVFVIAFFRLPADAGAL